MPWPVVWHPHRAVPRTAVRPGQRPRLPGLHSDWCASFIVVHRPRETGPALSFARADEVIGIDWVVAVATTTALEMWREASAAACFSADIQARALPAHRRP